MDYEEKAAREFNRLFEHEKTCGYTDGEAARRVLCGVNTERNHLERAVNAGEISSDQYVSRVAVLSPLGVQACEIWDAERSAAEAREA